MFSLVALYYNVVCYSDASKSVDSFSPDRQGHGAENQWSSSRKTAAVQIQFDLATQCKGDFSTQAALMRPDFTDFVFSWAAIQLILYNSQSPLSLSSNVTSALQNEVLKADQTSQDPRIQVKLSTLPTFKELPKVIRQAFATAVCSNIDSMHTSSAQGKQTGSNKEIGTTTTTTSSSSSGVSGLDSFCTTYLKTGAGSKNIPRRSFIPFQNLSNANQQTVVSDLCSAIDKKWSAVVESLYTYFQQMGYTEEKAPSMAPSSKPVTVSPTFPPSKQPNTKAPTKSPVTKKPVTKKPVTATPISRTTTSPTQSSSTLSPSPSPAPVVTTSKPVTSKPKWAYRPKPQKPKSKPSTAKPSQTQITAMPTTVVGENLIYVPVKFTALKQNNTMLTASDIIRGNDNGVLSAVIMAVSQVIDQSSEDEVLQAYHPPSNTTAIAWDIDGTSTNSRRRLSSLLYSGSALIYEAPNNWIYAKLPFRVVSWSQNNSTSGTSQSRSGSSNSTYYDSSSSSVGDDDWCDDDGGSGESSSQILLTQYIHSALKSRIADGGLLSLLQGLDPRIQSLDYLQLQSSDSPSTPTTTESTNVSNYALQIVGLAMFALSSVLCFGLLFAGHQRKMQRKKEKQWKETVGSEQAVNKFLEMGLALDEHLNKMMHSSTPVAQPKREGSLLIGNSLCITEETAKTGKSGKSSNLSIRVTIKS